MTINRCLEKLSAKELACVKRYRERIQPFAVAPSSTLEFDGQFSDDGENIFTEINLNEDNTIDDMFCTCGGGGLCIHLAVMMVDMVERDIIRLSGQEKESKDG